MTASKGHQHINTIKRSFYQGYGSIRLKISKENLEKKTRGYIRSVSTTWKCTICGPIYLEANCWNLVHSEGFKI